jgi:hypothetical protein
MRKKVITKLSQQLDAAQHTLEELRSASDCDAYPALKTSPEHRHRSAHEVAVRSLAGRRARSRYFGSAQIFGEPAWDILLDLYIRQADSENVSFKSVVVSSGGSAATAGLWLKLLEERQLILSEDDPVNEGCMLIRLTPEGKESMTRYLNEITS